MSDIKLKYNGDGNYIMGVPARDLTTDDIDLIVSRRAIMGDDLDTVIEQLTRYGLYSQVGKATKKTDKKFKVTKLTGKDEDHGNSTNST